jgi:hypothetical protein
MRKCHDLRVSRNLEGAHHVRYRLDTMQSDCNALLNRLAEVVDRHVGDCDTVDPEIVALRAHALRCAPCERLVARHEHIAALLSAPLPVPSFDVPVPRGASTMSVAVDPSATPGRRAVLLRRAVAAAALICVAVLAAEFLPRGSPSPRSTQPAQGEPVRITSIVSVRPSPGVPDEALLRLAAGAEAVASLRPALAQ